MCYHASVYYPLWPEESADDINDLATKILVKNETLSQTLRVILIN